MEEIVDIILQAVDNASDIFTGVTDSANEMGSTIQEGADGATDSMSNLESGAEDTKEAIDGIADLMAFEVVSDYVGQLADAMWELADKAGTVQDSWTRVGLAAEGAGINIDSMKGSISNLAGETGRAGGTIRESFIQMSSAGITSLDTMETLFKGASAQAFILGTDVDSLTNKFSGMAMKSSIAERTLKGTGITVEELGTVLGIQGATIDEVNAKWETMDTDARAAALGQAAAMNEGKEANEEYKQSWEGLQAQIDIAKGKLEVMLGKVLLPVLIPALQAAGRILDWFGDTLEGVMNGPLGGFISVIGSLAAGLILAFGAITVIEAGMGFFAASLQPAILASWELLAPWLPWIAIGVAIVAIIYEIGKAFGWWTDASSMIDALWAGIQRLWSAFINHPDVQAAIQAITGALQWLWGAIQNAGQAILEFFGISTSGDFDVVRALIDGVGAAWDAIKAPIEFVIQLFTAAGQAGNAAADAFGAFWNDTLVPFGEWLSSIFAPVWSLIGDLINAVTPFVNNLMNAFNLFATGQMDLPNLIWTVLTTLFNAYVTIFSMIISRVTSWGQSILSRGISAATSFVSGIVNRITSLPGRVYSILIGVVSRIVSAIQSWITNAKTKAQGIVDGVGNVLSGTYNAVANALSNVKDAIVKPFQDAYNEAKKWWDQITSLGGAWGGESAYGGDIAPTVNYTNDSGPVTVEHNLNISLDLQNVPSNISTSQLIAALTDRNVLRELTSNSDFQLLDGQAKERLNLKVNRARGV